MLQDMFQREIQYRDHDEGAGCKVELKGEWTGVTSPHCTRYFNFKLSVTFLFVISNLHFLNYVCCTQDPGLQQS